MQVKTKIKQSFAAAAQSYDNVAALQRQVGRELWRQCRTLPSAAILLDVGCGTGFMLGELIAQHQKLPEFMIALDIAEPMLHAARQRLCAQQNMAYVCADAESLPLQANSVDVAVSNLTLQWCRDLAAVFKGIHRILKPGGRFEFSTFGAGTLQELQQAWLEVDNYQHVNDFYQADEISGFLKQADLNVGEMVVTQHQIQYPSVYDLMLELKQLGARTIMGGHNPNLCGKAAMQRMITAYPKHSAGASIRATFAVIRGSVTRAC